MLVQAVNIKKTDKIKKCKLSVTQLVSLPSILAIALVLGSVIVFPPRVGFVKQGNSLINCLVGATLNVEAGKGRQLIIGLGAPGHGV